MDESYQTVDDYIEELLSLGVSTNDMVDARIAEQDFEGLLVHRDSHGVRRLCSPEVNLYGNTYEFAYDGKDAIMWVSTESKGVRVFACPPSILIGDRRTGYFGVVPAPDLEELIERVSFDKDAYRAAKNFLDAQKPVSYA